MTSFIKKLLAATIFVLATGTAFAQDAKVIRFAHHLPDSSEQHIAAMLFAEKVADYSKGALKVEVLPGGQMGGQREIIESVQLGTIEMGYGESGLYANYIPAFGILTLPYLYTSEDHWLKVVTGDIGKDLAQKLSQTSGIRVLNWLLAGYRDTYLVDKVINKPDDFKGLKIRVPESPVFIQTFATLNAQPTPIPGPEIYTSLQTHVVDAMEGTPEVAYTFKLFEVAKYGSKTRHILFDGSFAINEGFYQSLSDDQKEIITKASIEAADAQRAQRGAREEAWFVKLKEAGMTINEVDTAPFQEILGPLQDDFAKKANADDILAAIRQLQ